MGKELRPILQEVARPEVVSMELLRRVALATETPGKFRKWVEIDPKGCSVEQILRGENNEEVIGAKVFQRVEGKVKIGDKEVPVASEEIYKPGITYIDGKFMLAIQARKEFDGQHGDIRMNDLQYSPDEERVVRTRKGYYHIRQVGDRIISSLKQR